ncbi:hypothetical protein RRG08_053925, partial [Elysia crispata]
MKRWDTKLTQRQQKLAKQRLVPLPQVTFDLSIFLLYRRKLLNQSNMSAEDMSNTKHIFDTFLDPGMGMEKSVNTYGAWAKQYNKMLTDHAYSGPRAAADSIVKRFQSVADKDQVRIMDMACGTGLVAEDLKSRGYHNIDGVDPAQGMLEVAREKGLYRNTWCAYVGTGKQLPIED